MIVMENIESLGPSLTQYFMKTDIRPFVLFLQTLFWHYVQCIFLYENEYFFTSNIFRIFSDGMKRIALFLTSTRWPEVMDNIVWLKSKIYAQIKYLVWKGLLCSWQLQEVMDNIFGLKSKIYVQIKYASVEERQRWHFCLNFHRYSKLFSSWFSDFRKSIYMKFKA